MFLLRLKGISKEFHEMRSAISWFNSGGSYGRTMALSGIDLAMDTAEAVGLVGESGAGKSTLAGIAAGLIRPTAGSVEIAGLNPFNGERNRHRISREVQVVWQDVSGSFDPRIRVGDSVTEPFRIHKMVEKVQSGEAVKKLFSDVGLSESLVRCYPRELSGGELQRAVIARAMALKPKLLICDEPASALDARLKLQFARLMVELGREKQLAYLMISHDLDLVRETTSRVMVIYRGSIVETGPTAAVLSEPLHPYTKLLVESDPSSGKWKPASDNGTGITEDILSLYSEGERCSFFGTCRDGLNECLQDKPTLKQVGNGRSAACFNLEVEKKIEVLGAGNRKFQ